MFGVATEYFILQGVLVGVYIIYAYLLILQSRFFCGKKAVQMHLIPQLNKIALLCATFLLILQLALLVDPFGVLPIYPVATYLFVHSIQFGICGFAYSAYVYHSVQAAFRITFQRPVQFWRKLIVYESMFAFFSFLLLTILAVESDAVVFLAVLEVVVISHITFQFVISAFCHIRVIGFFNKFLAQTTHNPEFLIRSRNIVRHKLTTFLVVFLVVVGSSLTYTLFYLENQDLMLTILRDPQKFVFIQAGLIEISDFFFFSAVLFMGWLPSDYKGGLSKLHPATPVLFPVKASTSGTSRHTMRDAEMTDRSSFLSSHRNSGLMKSDAISALESEETIYSYGNVNGEQTYEQHRFHSNHSTKSLDGDGEGYGQENRKSTPDGASTILSEAHFSQIWRSIKGTLLYGHCVRLFSVGLQEIGLHTFFDETINQGPTVVIIQTAKNEIIGGFSSHSWQQNNIHYGSGETFLFAFQPHFVKYAWSEDNEFFMLTIRNAWPAALDAYIALGSSSDSQINPVEDCSKKITGHFSYATSGPAMPCGDTGTPALLGENKEEFTIRKFEVWGFQADASTSHTDSSSRTHSRLRSTLSFSKSPRVPTQESVDILKGSPAYTTKAPTLVTDETFLSPNQNQGV